MDHGVQQVEEGGAVDSPGWAADGHFCATSLPYNITVLVYSTQTNEWSVFSESGSCGYVCLLNCREHFDVLHGINGPPAIPVAATTHAVDGHDLDYDAWRSLQCDYNFAKFLNSADLVLMFAATVPPNTPHLAGNSHILVASPSHP